MKNKISYLIIISGLSIALVAFYTYFNRNAERTIPKGKNITAPADGTVTCIDDNKIEIFIGLTDVHFQRIPYDGVIKKIKECSDINTTTLSTELGDILIERRSGAIARTIRTFIKVGDKVKKGDIFGRILLGSHASITIPSQFKIKVKVGDHILAGETILAE